MAVWRSNQSLKVSLLTLVLSLAVLGAVFVGGRLTDTVRAAEPGLLGSAKQVSSANATPGQTLTYTVAVSNSGAPSATVRLTDTLPVSVTYAVGSASSGATYNSNSRSITWNGSVPAGSSTSISYRAVITSPLDNGVVITNSATINGGNGSVFDTVPGDYNYLLIS